MNETPNFKIFPKIPKQIYEKNTEIYDVIPRNGLDYFWDSILPFGCLTIIVCGILAAIVCSIIGFNYFFVVLIVFVITFIVIRVSKAQNKNKEIARSAQKRENESVEIEARNLSLKLNNIIISSQQEFLQLGFNLKNAFEHLEAAQIEFADRAFSPFWDEVEKAMASLGSFKARVQALTVSCNSYTEALKNCDHNFPNTIVEIDKMTDIKPVLTELQKVIRMGQKDFEFATILEHRRTRKVLIAGFRSLEDAIGNIAYSVESSFSELQKSASYGVSSIVEEQKKMRFGLKEP